ncbi:MAG: thiamine-phosphate synthase family protein [Thermoplasmatota archaeon]
MNVRCREETVEAARRAGLRIDSFRREEQPADAPSSVEWGTAHVCERMGGVPDLIFDIGGFGKEPMIRLLGRSPSDLVAKWGRLLAAMPRA